MATVTEPVTEPSGWANARARLLNEMHAALSKSPAGYVNLSIPKHAVTTPCLWELAYDQKLKGKSLDVRWRDGSRSAFPCGVMPQPTHNSGLDSVLFKGAVPVTLRLGLMSFRHPELDYIVDLYACRNRELASLQSMAAEEAYAFSRANDILSDAAIEEAIQSSPESRGILIEVYHTGLEPMVVGFYRGVISAIHERYKARGRARRLALMPKFFVGKPQKKGLTPNSPGCDSAHYVQSKVWM